jgi:hypothetical protein
VDQVQTKKFEGQNQIEGHTHKHENTEGKNYIEVKLLL